MGEWNVGKVIPIFQFRYEKSKDRHFIIDSVDRGARPHQSLDEPEREESLGEGGGNS